MSSAFFRKPGEDSSDTSSDEDEEVEELSPSRQRSSEIKEDDAELATTESLSSNASFSITDNQDDRRMPNIDQHRNLMLATLLEDFYKTRAAELINSNSPGANFHRQSPEVQALASKLYAEASQALSANGLLPAPTTSEGFGNVRRQYLSGLDNLSLRKIQDTDLIPDNTRKQIHDVDNSLAIVRADRRGSHEVINVIEEPMSSLIMQTGRMSISSPHSDMALTYTSHRHSHYESSFQQLKLLGKGGFGRVYHAFNVFDRKEYAVKKIPLSPRLSQRYRESGHQELESVLREVQALAQLDHNNVVRYHATWIEEPRSQPPTPLPPSAYTSSRSMFFMPRQRLLDNRPSFTPPMNIRKSSPVQITQTDRSDGIVFGSDSVSEVRSHGVHAAMQDWSSRNLQPEDNNNDSSMRESEFFTDGHAGPVHGSLQSDHAIDGSVYVLHVQMSMYPLTLAQYLSPPPTNSTSALSSPTRRHCFHLVPALRILLGILCGLQYIHARGMVHRDIKPSNIFISGASYNNPLLVAEGFHDVGICAACPVEQGSSYHVNPRIGDFGLVAELARNTHLTPSDGNPVHSSSDSGRAVGTEYYRPPPMPWYSHSSSTSNPRQQKPPIDEKIDVFALGVILVEMLYRCATASERMQVLKDLQRGRIPKGLGRMAESEVIVEPSRGQSRDSEEKGADHAETSRHAPGTGDKVEECIRGMIERDPSRRWSCNTVKDKLSEILRGCKMRVEFNGGQNNTDKLEKVRSLTGTEDSNVEFQ